MASEQEHLIWQENTPLLYSFLNLAFLQWPSLTVQWTPHGDENCGRFLLGSHCESPADNYVQFVDVPIETTITMENRRYAKHADYFGFDYEPNSYNPFAKIFIPHGSINKARVSSLAELGAAITSTGYACLFDSNGIKARLCGHAQSGWGLAWSHFESKDLVTCSDEGCVCIWDISKGDGSFLRPITQYTKGHTAAPQSVATSYDNPAVFFTCGDDRKILVWDVRIPNSDKAFLDVCTCTHEVDSFNAIATNKFRPWLLATGDTEGEVGLWDLRGNGHPVGRLSGHSGPVNSVEFSDEDKTDGALLLSGSGDRKAIVWDLTAIGREQSLEMAQSGPAELMFSHGGHLAPVQDVSWGPNSMVTTVDGGNRWHIWKMDESVFDGVGESDRSILEEAEVDEFTVE